MSGFVRAISITDINDPRISPYRALKDRDVAKLGDLFIAEGEHVTRRLLQSDFAVHSVLLDEKRVEEFSSLVPAHVPLYSAPTSLMTQIIGFRFHSGIISCGIRKPPVALTDILASLGRVASEARPSPLVICPDLNNAENLGGIIRLCAGFGASALILGPLSVDPFWRQSIRVSMGTVFSLPIIQSQNLLADLQLIKNHHIPIFATVLDPTAVPLDSIIPPLTSALLFGSEAHGLPLDLVLACDHKTTIPMRLGTDSLNVAVTAGIFLFHFTKSCPQ